MVESEFAAMSAASAPPRPARAATRRRRAKACCYMAEALYNASGLGLPIVMTVANRAIGAPINIWNDHSDAMSQRDSGWIQLYARVQPGGRRPARAGVPAGGETVHAGDGVHGRLHPHPRRSRRSTSPTRSRSTRSCRRSEPHQQLDPDDPVTIGAMVGPEAFTEVKYLMHAKQLRRSTRSRGWPTSSRASSAAQLRRAGHAATALDDAETVVVGTGVRARHRRGGGGRAAGRRGAGRACSASRAFRPFPPTRCARRSRRAGRVVVLEKALAVGAGGIVGQNVRVALRGCRCEVYDVVAGLGGRPVTGRRLRGCSTTAGGRLDPRRLHFLDLDHDLVERELARPRADAAGPHAEHMLRDLGTSLRPR